ncbi:hypothetical protein GCM10010308_52750 [Streptomyces vinaceusdrappus]|nr:hypothetical protein GCM10010308_52750 [Streptomyces vinaceusdrappus]
MRRRAFGSGGGPETARAPPLGIEAPSSTLRCAAQETVTLRDDHDLLNLTGFPEPSPAFRAPYRPGVTPHPL